VKPIAIFQHEPDVPPAYFETWLRAQRLPWVVLRIDRGEPVPADPLRYSGLCFLGGRMSVNDPLPWIEPACELIRAADRALVPVIGHCLGGQLLAKALGAPVARNPVKELGWHRLQVTDAALAAQWLGASATGDEWFQWHGERFELPPAAKNFLASDLCPNQAFVIERAGFAHLGMQFHCEMTAELIEEWVGPEGRREIDEERARTGGLGAQTPEEILADVAARVARSQALAAHLYGRWVCGLSPQLGAKASRAGAQCALGN